MSDTSIAARIWNLCHVLRDDGIVYHKYLSELTYLIFLKTAAETGAESALPEGCRWDDLLGQPKKGLLSFYRKMLTKLGEDADDENVRAIFSFPTTVFSHDENLEKVVSGIQSLDWHSATKDGLGTIYEALLERNATEARSGAGQYFTPRALVDSMVRLLAPGPGDTVQDPSAGTGGFLISAHEFIREKVSRKSYTATPPTFSGIEIEHDTYRLCLMNIFLHQMNGRIIHGDALTDDAKGLGQANVVIANPPFGTTAGGARPRRQDLPFPTSNKQLLFLQHIYLSLAPGGRAAVVVPDNVISDDGMAKKVRDDLMDRCNLHTVLRLPEGLFYAASVKTNVLFFSNDRNKARADDTWVYDLRSGMPRFGRNRPLSVADLRGFEAAYGSDPCGKDRQKSTNPRWKKFTRAEVASPSTSNSLSWLHREEPEVLTVRPSREIVQEARQHLQAALGALDEFADALSAAQADQGTIE